MLITKDTDTDSLNWYVNHNMSMQELLYTKGQWLHFKTGQSFKVNWGTQGRLVLELSGISKASIIYMNIGKMHLGAHIYFQQHMFLPMPSKKI